MLVVRPLARDRNRQSRHVDAGHHPPRGTRALGISHPGRIERPGSADDDLEVMGRVGRTRDEKLHALVLMRGPSSLGGLHLERRFRKDVETDREGDVVVNQGRSGLNGRKRRPVISREGELGNEVPDLREGERIGDPIDRNDWVCGVVQ